MEASLKQGSRECTEGKEEKEKKKTADGEAPATGSCISTKTRSERLLQKGFLQRGGGRGTSKTIKDTEQGTKSRTNL